MQLISFIVNQWQVDEREKNNKPDIIYVTIDNKCYNISKFDMVKVGSLSRQIQKCFCM